MTRPALLDASFLIALERETAGRRVRELTTLARHGEAGADHFRELADLLGQGHLTVEDLRAAIDGGATPDPVLVFHDGTDYWLADGFHRVAARAKVGRLTVKAEVRQGTRRDAVLYACGANATHGLRRTNADKRRAVETLLRDEEWSQWSDREIARRCGVGADMVGDARRSICRNPTDTPTERTVERNGKTYTQNTANIGRKPASRAEEPKVDEPTASRAVAAPAPSAGTVAAGTLASFTMPVRRFSAWPRMAMPYTNDSATLRAAIAFSLPRLRASLAARCNSCSDHSYPMPAK